MNVPENRPRLAAGLCLVILLSGCGAHGVSERPTADQGAPAVRATAMRPERKTLIRTIELPGRAEAVEVAPLYSKVTGYVVKIPVDIGDAIQGPRENQPGTALCELLVPELTEELAQKAATVAQTRAEVLQSDAGVKVAEAAVRSAAARVQEAQASVSREESRFARWQSEFQRVVQLVESGAMTKKIADETRAELDAADAGRKEVAARIASVEALQQEAAAGLEKAKADAVAVRARLAVAEADERRSAAMLQYTTIRAPFDGVVVHREVHTGHLVQAGGANGHAPLLTVMRTDPIRVAVDIPEIDAVRVVPGTKVELRMPSMPGQIFVGTVTRTGWSLDAMSRTLAAEVDVPNAEGRWRPGTYVQVKLTVAELPAVFALPKAAIVTQEKLTYCYSVGGDGVIRRLPIELGLQAGTEFEVRSGLTGDEQVITINASSFREGQVVEVAPPAK